MHRSRLFFRILVILLLTSISISYARAGDEPPGTIGEPYSIPWSSNPLTTGGFFPDFTGCGGVNVSVVNAAYEQEVLDLVNSERADRSIPPLKRVAALDNAARYHATDMGQDNYFAHDSYDRVGGTLQFVCGVFTRLVNYYSNASAENIAAGYPSPQSVMNGWMGSSGHRANILSTSNWTIGVGYNSIDNSGYYHYWVQDFGHPLSEYPLIINRDAASTTDRDVSIYIYGNFQQMRLKNDNAAWGNWQTFQNSFPWTLTGGVGDRTVTAELKTGSTTYTSSDTIYLNGSDEPTLGNLPDSFTFLYSIADARLQPADATFTPLDINTTALLTWTLSSSGSWFSVAPSSGITPQSFQVTPDNFNTGAVNTYTGGITITVTSPSETYNSPHTIDLTLIVFDSSINQVFLPIVHK